VQSSPGSREGEVVHEPHVASQRLRAHAGERELHVAELEPGHVARGGCDERTCKILLCTSWSCTIVVMGSVQPARQRRINMRVSEHQERVLRAAADLGGETLTGFVLSVATERAEQVLERAQRINLSSEAFRRFVEALDAPVEEMPTLRRYTHTQSPIPAR